MRGRGIKGEVATKFLPLLKRKGEEEGVSKIKKWQRLEIEKNTKFYGLISGVICPSLNQCLKLAIEIDGDSHFTPRSKKRDEARDKKLAEHGIVVLRFTNLEAMENLEGVTSKIMEKLPPLNLPLRMGEKIKGI